MAKRRRDAYPGAIIGHLRLLKRVNSPKKASPVTKSRWRVRCERPLEDGSPCLTEITLPQFYMVRVTNPRHDCGFHKVTSLKTQYKYEYHCWAMMRTRCNYEKHVAFKDYGGRGIKVCEEWDTLDGGFERWFEHIGPCPERGHTQDRIRVNEGYSPGNVRWASASEQRRNQRSPEEIAASRAPQ